MTQTIYRLYDSEAQGKKAAASLTGLGFQDVFQFTAPATKGGIGAAARSALIGEMLKAQIWKSHAETCVDRMGKGNSLVVVHAPFSTALTATETLDSHGPIDSNVIAPNYKPDFRWEDAAPLSSMLRIPVLAKNGLFAESVSGVSSLTKGKAFLSNLLGIPLLKDGPEHRTSSWGLPLLSKSATPLSSMIGMRVLSSSATPLSSLFHLPVLKK